MYTFKPSAFHPVQSIFLCHSSAADPSQKMKNQALRYLLFLSFELSLHRRLPLVISSGATLRIQFIPSIHSLCSYTYSLSSSFRAFLICFPLCFRWYYSPSPPAETHGRRTLHSFFHIHFVNTSIDPVTVSPSGSGSVHSPTPFPRSIQLVYNLFDSLYPYPP